jgi:phage terminase large subunit-like protein
MAAKPKLAEPTRPLALSHHLKAWWDEASGLWRESDFWYDENAADKAVAFFANYLVFSEGQWAGQPFILESWQEHDIVRRLFGWKRADATRRYRRAYVWIARKNGKTELAAGISLLVLLGDAEPGGQVFSIAAEKDQAALVFNKAVNMISRSAGLGQLLETYKESIYCSQLNASFRPLSGKPGGKHGLSMSGLIGDEIHEWRNGDLYTFVHDSAAARRQPLEFLISTAGVKGSHGEEVWDECQGRLNGDIDDPETLVVVYAPDPDDDWTKPETWAKANPNLGVSLKLEEMEAACKQARQIPRIENDFRRYRLNQWTDQAVRWLPMDAVDDDGRRFGWDHCKGEIPWKDLEAHLRFKTCFGGLDLSSTQDLSALVWWFPIQEGLNVPACLARFYKPRDLIKVHGQRDKLPYERWVKEGALTATPGNVVDYAFIQAQIYRDAEQFKIAYQGAANRERDQGGLAIDRFNATETAVKLEQEGIPVVLFGQGFLSLSAPSKELERLVVANGFHHGDHPLLRRHAQAVAIETDSAGNIKPSKSVSTQRIDGIAGLVNALGISARGAERPAPSIYEERGIRTL